MLVSADIGGISVRPDTYVWIRGRGNEKVTVEYLDRVAQLPISAVASCPVNGPSQEELDKLDSCFDLRRDAFEDEHVDHKNYFSIQRCRAHGSRFLRDTFTGVAWYDRLTLLRPEDNERDPLAIWSYYHPMSYDWLILQGRTK
jgi:hypothetical protein